MRNRRENPYADRLGFRLHAAPAIRARVSLWRRFQNYKQHSSPWDIPPRVCPSGFWFFALEWTLQGKQGPKKSQVFPIFNPTEKKYMDYINGPSCHQDSGPSVPASYPPTEANKIQQAFPQRLIHHPTSPDHGATVTPHAIGPRPRV